MQIAAKKAVTISYTLKDDAEKVIDTSDGRAPLVYLHGGGNIVPGLEKALEGKQAGDAVKVSLTAAEGYGMRDEKQIRKVPVRKLPEGKITVGMRFRVQTEGGPIAALVTAIQGDYATIDANHPLAGMNLHFDVNVIEVRDATEEELTHGHAHGPGGHH
ncbi:MAG TPA: peptidylprolyl isomerase [Polyangia bacterium]|jgi:FKBP-type peptidyl-prolyl cis-trans isomerase SlyD